jgi:hypothetical protein
MLKHRYKTECPRCGKLDEMVLEGRHDATVPRVNCGDCLFNNTEVVALRVTPLHGLTKYELKMNADRIDGYDRDDLGESPDF